MKIELVEGGKAPQRMTDGAVGFDVFARQVDLVSELVPPDGGGEPPTSAKIYLGFKIDCNEVHEPLYSEQETADGGYIANWMAPMNFAVILLPRSAGVATTDSASRTPLAS